MARQLPDRYRITARTSVLVVFAVMNTGCSRRSSPPGAPETGSLKYSRTEKLAAVVAEAARRATNAVPKSGSPTGPPEEKMPEAKQFAPLNSRSPRIAAIAKDYPNLRAMTIDSVYVDPELAMLCAGVSAQQVANARKHKGPHAHTAIRVFMNDLAANAFRQSLTPYPVGAIIVKEKRGLSYSADPESRDDAGYHTHDGVGGMVKRPQGFDTAHGDWEYFYFENPSEIESGKISSCVACHGAAARTDYVFGDWAKRR
jgi:Cytochrome P460